MGDEIGLLNDYSYLQDEDLAGDNRWIHRPFMDWNAAAQRYDEHSTAAQIFQGLLALVAARKATPALHAQAHAQAVWAHNEHVFALLRHSPRGRVLIMANMSEETQTVPQPRLQELGFGEPLTDMISGRDVPIWPALSLAPYEGLWLVRQTEQASGRFAYFD
jgi:amylosucrase